MSLYKQEPVELDNDDDDIRSIASSECTVDTSATNGGGIVSMETIKDKMAILRRDVKLIGKEQKCAKLEANQANNEIVAKLKDVEKKAKMTAQTELAEAMEQLKADFADKLVLLQQQMKANFDTELKLMEEKLKTAEERPNVELNELNSTMQTMQQKMDELTKENADLKEQQRFYVPLVKVLNPKENDWNWPSSFDQKLYNYYTKQGFPISGENIRTDSFIGKMVYYFEVQLGP